jgi:hypothetical protein
MYILGQIIYSFWEVNFEKNPTFIENKFFFAKIGKVLLYILKFKLFELAIIGSGIIIP